MRHTSRAIALTYHKYGESSIIAKLFTEKHGLQTFIVKQVRSKKSKLPLGFFQPLQLLEISTSYIEKNNIQYLNDVALANIKLSNIINHNFLFQFIAEVLLKILQEAKTEKRIFQFIWELKINILDSKKNYASFSVLFLIRLSFYLGFLPSTENINNSFFDLEKGTFVNNETPNTIDKENSNYLKPLLMQKNINIPLRNQKVLLKNLIEYYRLQHYELKNLSSHWIINCLQL